jgi:hypothetical protein
MVKSVFWNYACPLSGLERGPAPLWKHQQSGAAQLPLA